MTDYEWLTEMGLCHRCRKEKMAPGKKFCFDCLEKIREENRSKYNPEQAKNYRERRREIYAEKKRKGICVRCKKPATNGMYCYEHYIKERRKSIKRAETEKERRHAKGLVTEERKEQGLCIWCGRKSVDGKNACEAHILIFQNAGKKAKEASGGEWNFRRYKGVVEDGSGKNRRI